MLDNLPSISIAKVSKIYGTKGELIVRLYDVFPEEFDIEEPFYAQIGGITVPLFANFFERRGKNKAVVVFDDFDTEYRARELVGLELLTLNADESDEAVKDDEVYYDDMVGYTLNDVVSGKSGIISEYVDNPNNPLFVVDMNGTEVFVPVADDIIVNINTLDSYIEVRLPDGLLDLYEGDNYGDEY